MSSTDRPSGQQEDRIDIPFLTQYFQTSSDASFARLLPGWSRGVRSP